LTKRRYRWQR